LAKRTILITEQQASDEFARARTLAKLAPHLSDAEKPTALLVARALHDAGAQARALSSLATVLPAEQRREVLQEALTSARQIINPWLRVRAYAPIAMRLPTEEKTVVAQAMLDTTTTIDNDWQRGRALGLLAHIAPPEVKAQAVKVADAIGTPYARALALSTYADRLTHDQLIEVLQAAPLIVDEWLRASLLTTVVQHLPQEYFQQALTETRQFQDRAARVVALNDLAAQRAAPEHEQLTLRLEALSLARHLEDEGERAEMLLVLLDALPDEVRSSVALEALMATRAVPEAALRAPLLADWLEVAPAGMKDEVVIEALACARQIEDIDSRAEALSGLIGDVAADQQTALKDEVLRLLA
jgi:hypothetical protein